MGGTIDIFPKKFIGTTYTQTTDEAVDCGGANAGVLQVMIEPALTGTDTLVVELQHSTINSADLYLNLKDAAGSDVKLTFNTSSPSNQIIKFSQFAQLLRLKITATFGSTTKGTSVHGRMTLKQST